VGIDSLPGGEATPASPNRLKLGVLFNTLASTLPAADCGLAPGGEDFVLADEAEAAFDSSVGDESFNTDSVLISAASSCHGAINASQSCAICKQEPRSEQR